MHITLVSLNIAHIDLHITPIDLHIVPGPRSPDVYEYGGCQVSKAVEHVAKSTRRHHRLKGAQVLSKLLAEESDLWFAYNMAN